jgi:hypothetical protein
MNMFSAIVAIVAIGAIATIARSWIESRKHSNLDQQRLNDLESELRERIETLERIVTDQREQLKQQIDEL